MRRDHHHIFHFLMNRELSELYITIAIKSLAISLIGIFIPLFLLKKGFSLTEVSIFYAIEVLIAPIFFILSSKFIRRYGVKHSIFVSIPLLISFYYLVGGIEKGDKLFYLLPIISSLSASFFWMAFHIDFSKFSKDKHRGEELGLLESLTIVLGMLAPFAGGLILTFYSFKTLFFISVILLTISGIPLMFSDEVHEVPKFSFREILKMKEKKKFISFFGAGFVGMAAGLLWPIFIFNVVKEFLSVGALISIGDTFLAFFLLVIGKLADTNKRKKIFKAGVFLRTISLGIRGFAKTGVHIALLNVLAGISYAMIEIPFMTKFYDKASNSNVVNLTIMREIMLSLGRLSLILVFIATGSFTISFIIAGISSFIYLFFK